MLDPKPTQTPLPESLRQQLVEYRRQLWRTKIAEAIFAGIFGLLISFLVVFIIDRFSSTPPIARLVILLAGTSLSAVFAPLWLHRWVWKHRDHDQLAKLISRKHPGLGDRLLGVIDLANQSENEDTLSPRLRSAAMESVAAETSKRKLDDLLPLSRHRKWSMVVIILFLLAGAALTTMPEAGINSLQRWLFPLSDTPRYTFTQLETFPTEVAVPMGEAFAMEFRLSEESRWQPESGKARFGSQDSITSQLSDGGYRFDFPGQLQRNFVRVEIGDAIHKILVIPSLRPTITRSVAELDYPAYLQRPPEKIQLSTGNVRAVGGSKVRFSIEADRLLNRAEAGPIDALQVIQEDPFQSLPESEMLVDGVTATTTPIDVADRSLRVPLSWTDHLGLDGAPGFELRIEAAKDEAPTVFTDGVSGTRAMLASETVDFNAVAADDFGLKEVGIEWSGEASHPGAGDGASGDLILQKGSPDLERAAVPVAFSPEAFGIRPQKLTLRAFATDYLENRGRVYSQPITLYVLTLEEHAQMLKNRLDRAISELEDSARLERNLFEENQRLERLSEDELKEESNQQRLGTQQQREEQQAEAMRKLAESVENLMKDSARNESIEPDTLRRMSGMMQSLRELGETDLPEVGEKLEAAGDPKNADEKTERDMEDAVEKQKEALEKMRDTIEKANETNQRFEASTFVSRLKKAASDQDAVTRSTLDSSDQFGLRPEELDPADLGNMEDVIRLQATTTSDVRWIEEDLGHFFTRTADEDYGKVLKAMQASDIQISLEDIRQQIGRNQGFLAATQSSEWADEIRKWAALLEDAAASAQGGGGGGGASAEDEDFEFMLRVMRMVQKEQDLRAKTRALETIRRAMKEEETP